MSRLLYSQATKHKCERFYCPRCLNGFTFSDSLQKHREYSEYHDALKVVTPEMDEKLQFKHFYNSMTVPFIVYADFEAFTKTIDTCQSNPKSSFTMAYQKHIPSSFCYYIKCSDDKIYKKDPVIYTTEREEDDVAQTFINKLEGDVKDIFNKIKSPKKMIFTVLGNAN